MSQPTSSVKTPTALRVVIIVAALGYFVDVYDLLLFSIVRITSLKDMGVPDGEPLLSTGLYLLNMQMSGMLLGGILWGIWGDKRGRLSVLFGSIFLYSIANILNGLVSTVPQYGALRLMAGLGLAGELGAGVTLVSEEMSKENRGYGTTIVASVGVMGAVFASIIGEYFAWRTCYFIGGVLGLLLLITRMAVYESGLFSGMQQSNARRGDLTLLFANRERILRYLKCIFSGFPTWFVVGILITFCREFGAALGMHELPVPGRAVMYTYMAQVVGDVASGLLSQRLRSRKKVLILFLSLTAVSMLVYLNANGASLPLFYLLCGLLGFSVGYWAIFITNAAEQFGTNLRATVATTTPNFARGALVPIAWAFTELKSRWGIVASAEVVGLVTVTIAIAAVMSLQEPFSKDLDFMEE